MILILPWNIVKNYYYSFQLVFSFILIFDETLSIIIIMIIIIKFY